MPKFYVTLEEIVRYEVEVDAPDADTAQNDAVEMWVQSQDPYNDFCGSGQGVEVVHYEMHDGDDVVSEPVEG